MLQLRAKFHILYLVIAIYGIQAIYALVNHSNPRILILDVAAMIYTAVMAAIPWGRKLDPIWHCAVYLTMVLAILIIYPIH